MQILIFSSSSGAKNLYSYINPCNYLFVRTYSCPYNVLNKTTCMPWCDLNITCGVKNNRLLNQVSQDAWKNRVATVLLIKCPSIILTIPRGKDISNDN